MSTSMYNLVTKYYNKFFGKRSKLGESLNQFFWFDTLTNLLYIIVPLHYAHHISKPIYLPTNGRGF